jgi:aminoglycoside phosphotransferase (APT) family kinase protein
VGNREGSHLVVKIARFPDQDSASISWTSPELVARGQREFRCLEQVARHFKSAPGGLTAVEPVLYIDRLNAIVMERVEGRAFWSEGLHPSRLLREKDVAKAVRWLGQAGRWLRWLHSIRPEESPVGRELSTADSLQRLFEHVSALESWGILLRSWPKWAEVAHKLQGTGHGDRVWLHGDYHPGNLWALPDGRLLALDTALEGHGSPFEDLGKFLVSLRTRRLRVLVRGGFPSPRILRRLEEAFLQGYFQGSPCDQRALLLHEGRYLFEKWLEGLTALRARLAAPVARRTAQVLLHPSYFRFTQEWMDRMVRLPERPLREVLEQ